MQEGDMQEWQNAVYDSFMNMVKAKDGDFEVLGQLSQAVSDAKSFDLMIEFISGHHQGKLAFEKRPRVGLINIEELHQLPKNTLGYMYADHLISNNLKMLETGEVNNDYQFLGYHITETHDIWHVVTGFGTNILGEIQLEAFSAAQLYASRFWVALLAKNLLKSVVFDIEISNQYLDAITQGWLMGKQAKLLFCIEWNTLWDTPLIDIRSSLNIIPQATLQ